MCLVPLGTLHDASPLAAVLAERLRVSALGNIRIVHLNLMASAVHLAFLHSPDRLLVLGELGVMLFRRSKGQEGNLTDDKHDKWWHHH